MPVLNCSIRGNYFLLIIVFCYAKSLYAQNWPVGIHDPSSIIKCKDKYWIFGTGDGITSKYSSDLVTWTDGPSPFAPGEYPAWIDKYTNDVAGPESFAGFFWAPDIIFMNGQYYLYYSASVWATAYSCIGVVVNKTLDPDDPEYGWVDQGDIGLYSPKWGWQINAIDPAMMRGPDNKIWMTYGSFNRDGIMVTEIDSITGIPSGQTISIANSWTGGDNYAEGEGGAMFYRDGYYYLIYNKGGCCQGIGSSYYMVIGRSTSPQGPFYDKNGALMRRENVESGGTVFFKHDDTRGLDDRFYGPGHFGLFSESGKDYVSFHYYNPNGYYPDPAPNNQGGPTLGFGFLQWGEDGWPSISFDFVEEGYYTLENVNSGKFLDLEGVSLESGTSIYQYSQDSTKETQKWLFKALGTGEYTIQNYADTSKYLEAEGPDYNDRVRIVNGYTGAINQKFRLVASTDGKLIIYPSTIDEILEIPSASIADTYVHLWPNTNHDCQRWYFRSFAGKIDTQFDNLVLSNRDTVLTINVESNTRWVPEVQESSWIEVLFSSGNGNGYVVIKVKANLTSEIRNDQIAFKTQTGKIVYVDIEQGGVPEIPLTTNPEGSKTNVYPNPSDGLFMIETNHNGEVYIYNQVGKQVAEMRLSYSRQLMDLSSLSKGVYILKIVTSEATSTQKVIIR
ncbi:family 43 glycosylhydrolase [Marinoscillum sp. MHG1-6]|uniref:family 43 glycosylhydrolase n=1 Tax=Marinoscillum sp. MHG1-6 TaxID=2959627 RepID=UPI0021578F97|nr:family 43 glycosylhydrolase [Marinoscillum sp. MHG1-6]